MSSRVTAALCALAITALLCGACGSGSGDHASSARTRRHAASPPAAGKVTGTAGTAGTAGAVGAVGGGGAQFCSAARKTGLASLRIVDSDNPDATGLLPAIDRLNAIAPAAIKADFGRFTRLEHDLLDRGHAGPPAVPDARTFAALRRVQSYLHNACGLPG